MSEEELDRSCVERCLRGDLEAFGTLIDRYQRPVFNAVLHLVGNYEDAKEVCQQAYMKAFEHLSSYDANRKFFSWIYRVAMNEAINHVQARKAWEPLGEEVVWSHPGPEETLEAAERRREIQKAVMALDVKYREVVILRHFLHLSYKDAAEALNLPEKTVKSRLFTARELLRAALEASGHAG